MENFTEEEFAENQRLLESRSRAAARATAMSSTAAPAEYNNTGMFIRTFSALS